MQEKLSNRPDLHYRLLLVTSVSRLWQNDSVTLAHTSLDLDDTRHSSNLITAFTEHQGRKTAKSAVKMGAKLREIAMLVESWIMDVVYPMTSNEQISILQFLGYLDCTDIHNVQTILSVSPAVYVSDQTSTRSLFVQG